MHVLRRSAVPVDAALRDGIKAILLKESDQFRGAYAAIHEYSTGLAKEHLEYRVMPMQTVMASWCMT